MVCLQSLSEEWKADVSPPTNQESQPILRLPKEQQEMTSFLDTGGKQAIPVYATPFLPMYQCRYQPSSTVLATCLFDWTSLQNTKTSPSWAKPWPLPCLMACPWIQTFNPALTSGLSWPRLPVELCCLTSCLKSKTNCSPKPPTFMPGSTWSCNYIVRPIE